MIYVKNTYLKLCNYFACLKVYRPTIRLKIECMYKEDYCIK